MAPIKPRDGEKKKPSSAGVKKSVAPTRKPKMPPKQAVVTNKQSLKTEKVEAPIFRHKIICSIGSLKSFGGGKVISHDDIGRWIKYHGGQHVREFTEDTTHLICSIEVFESAQQQNDAMNVGHLEKQVQRAQRLGKRRCHIVVYDWLEDCLTTRGKKSCRREKMYTLDRVMNRLARGLKITAEFFRRFDEGVKTCEELVDNSLYHIHYDATGFEFKVVLARMRTVTVGDKSTPQWEKYTLYLFESNALPHVYMVGAKLARPKQKSSMWREWCHPMDFYTAFKHWERFFFEKTGVTWDNRLEPLAEPVQTIVQPAPKKRGRKKAITNEEFLEEVRSLAPLPDVDLASLKFRYTRPQQPRSLGLLPLGYVLPEDRPDYVPAKQMLEDDVKADFDILDEDVPESVQQTTSNDSSQNPGQQSQRKVETQRISPPKQIISPIGTNKNPINLVGYDSDSEVEPDEPESEESEEESEDSGSSEDDENQVRFFNNVPRKSTHFIPGRSSSNSQDSRPRSASDNSNTSGTGSFHTTKSRLSSEIRSSSPDESQLHSQNQRDKRGGRESEAIVLSDSDSTLGGDAANDGEKENMPISSQQRFQSRSQSSSQDQRNTQSQLRTQLSKPMYRQASLASTSTSSGSFNSTSSRVHSPANNSGEDEEQDIRDPMDFDSQLPQRHAFPRPPFRQDTFTSRLPPTIARRIGSAGGFNSSFQPPSAPGRPAAAGNWSNAFKSPSASHFSSSAGHWQGRDTMGRGAHIQPNYGGYPKQNFGLSQPGATVRPSYGGYPKQASMNTDAEQ